MYASTEYYLHRQRRRGMGVVPVVAVATVTSLLAGLFAPARLTSGVKQSVYNDEIGDSRMVAVLANGTLASYIANVMLAPASTPWGTAYSPEAIAWARAKLAQVSTGSQSNATSATGQIVNAVLAAFQAATGTTPASSTVKTASVTGSISPLVLYGALGIAAYVFLVKKKGKAA